jgi:hypothetical protein
MSKKCSWCGGKNLQMLDINQVTQGVPGSHGGYNNTANAMVGGVALVCMESMG